MSRAMTPPVRDFAIVYGLIKANANSEATVTSSPKTPGHIGEELAESQAEKLGIPDICGLFSV